MASVSSFLGTRRTVRTAFHSSWFLLAFFATTPLSAKDPFRSGIAVVELDVAVLDRTRHPVRGLHLRPRGHRHQPPVGKRSSCVEENSAYYLLGFQSTWRLGSCRSC